MDLKLVADGDLTISNADLTEHIKFVGMSGKGKSMLNRLNENERQEWLKWMNAHPGANGMDWPGWVTVNERESNA